MYFLLETSQWTQILCWRDSPISSFVRGIVSFKISLETMKNDITKLVDGDNQTVLINI